MDYYKPQLPRLAMCSCVCRRDSFRNCYRHNRMCNLNTCQYCLNSIQNLFVIEAGQDPAVKYGLDALMDPYNVRAKGGLPINNDGNDGVENDGLGGDGSMVHRNRGKNDTGTLDVIYDPESLDDACRKAKTISPRFSLHKCHAFQKQLIAVKDDVVDVLFADKNRKFWHTENSFYKYVSAISLSLSLSVCPQLTLRRIKVRFGHLAVRGHALLRNEGQAGPAGRPENVRRPLQHTPLAVRSSSENVHRDRF